MGKGDPGRELEYIPEFSEIDTFLVGNLSAIPKYFITDT